MCSGECERERDDGVYVSLLIVNFYDFFARGFITICAEQQNEETRFQHQLDVWLRYEHWRTLTASTHKHQTDQFHSIHINSRILLKEDLILAHTFAVKTI